MQLIPHKLSQCRNANDLQAYLEEFNRQDPQALVSFAREILYDLYLVQAESADLLTQITGNPVSDSDLCDGMFTAFNLDNEPSPFLAEHAHSYAQDILGE